MAYKHNDVCLEKAGADEPIFVLRSTDKLAPIIVEHWACLVEAHSGRSAKIDEAMELAMLMRQWQREHGSKWPD